MPFGAARLTFLLRHVAAAGLLILLAAPVLPAKDPAELQRQYDAELVPLLRTYCFDCHGESDGEGEISLASYRNVETILKDRKVWSRVLAQVRLGTMPPSDGPELAADIRVRMTALIDQYANAVDCVKNPNAGKVVMRRLNRHEYRNTIRDLVGVDYQPADSFPGDDVGYGFDNIGDVLALPPLLMEKYLIAADEIAQQAIMVPAPAEIYERALAGSQLDTDGKFSVSNGMLNINSRGFVDLAPEFPFAGTFELVVTAFGDQAGDEPVKMEVRLQDKVVDTIEITSEEPQQFSLTIRSGRGKRKLELGFVNDYWNPDTKADRNLRIAHVHLKGTDTKREIIPSTKLPATHRKLIFQTPTDRIDADQASRAVIERLTSRAYRRPATQEEVNRLTDLARAVRNDGGTYEEGIQVALQALLVSPHFLFKVEQYEQRGADGQSRRLNQFELATRLSYFLWSSMPDDELFAAAWGGKLHDSKELRRQIARMLRDRRGSEFIENFASQWLQLRKLDTVRPDPSAFPECNDNVRQLLVRETLTFFASVVRQNLPVTTLLDGDFTYVNEELAKYYGIEGVKGPEFQKVSLQGTPRSGLLSQGSVLLVTSNPTRTSPVKRGKWILENLLNTPPPPPPPDVPELEKDALHGTLRERMEQHRANPACAACHDMMDPLGFALENFDAIGRWRTKDGSDPIDPSGSLPDGTKFNGIAELRNHLVQQRGEQFVACLTEKLMTYALGRGLEYYDKCAIDDVMAKAQQEDYRFLYLLAAIIESRPFQYQGDR